MTDTAAYSRRRSDVPGALATAAGPSLLLVDDDPATVQVLARMLAGVGTLRFALSGAEALRLAQLDPPDLVLADAEMPGMGGFELCRRMKADPMLADVPVMIVTSHGDVATEVAGFAAGAADFVRKPPVAEVVLARAHTQLRLKRLTDTLRAAAYTDALTGVANRRHYDAEIGPACARARRQQEALSLVLFDVDHFKAYNDHHGHLAGDHCLRAVAQTIQGVLQRPGDHLARFGGEEFALLLQHTEGPGALHVALHCVQAVALLRLQHAASPLGPAVTVSAGVAALCPAGMAPAEDAAQLLQAADTALYAAKAAGRGRALLCSG